MSYVKPFSRPRWIFLMIWYNEITIDENYYERYHLSKIVFRLYLSLISTTDHRHQRIPIRTQDTLTSTMLVQLLWSLPSFASKLFLAMVLWQSASVSHFMIYMMLRCPFLRLGDHHISTWRNKEIKFVRKCGFQL